MVSSLKTKHEKLLRKEITHLRQELNAALDGARELSQALDGIMVQVLLSHGQKIKGGYELRIPAVDLKANPYKISAKLNTEGNEYVITAAPMGTEE